MHLYIKNMVCPRCTMAVELILKEKQIAYSSIRLGELTLCDELSEQELEVLREALQNIGFEILDDHRKQLIEKVKSLMIEKVQHGDVEDSFSISKYIVLKLHKDYSLISKLFTQVEGITVEQFFILQKIEKVKEWLVYNEHSLGDIAVRLGYSSVQHLSSQFKRVTGITPGEFKKIGLSERKSIDNVSI